MLDGYQVTVICYQTHKDYLYCQRRQILDDHNKLIMEHPNKKRMKCDFNLLNLFVYLLIISYSKLAWLFRSLDPTPKLSSNSCQLLFCRP